MHQTEDNAYWNLSFFLTIWSSLPSFLLFILSTNPDYTYKVILRQNTVLFQEKFWIYYLEFLRQHDLQSIFSWPSFDPSIRINIYLERFIPRLLLWHAPVNAHHYFLYDALLIFIFMWVLLFLNKFYLSPRLTFNLYSLPFALLFSPLYYLNIYFHTLNSGIAQIQESWFSRNIVAVLALTLVLLTIPVSSKSSYIKNTSPARSAIFLVLALVHTYSALFALTGFTLYVLLCVRDGKSSSKVALLFPSTIPALSLIALNSVFLAQSSKFSQFLLLYGATFERQVNIREIIWYAALIVAGFLISRRRYRYILLIYGLSGIVLSNVGLLTGVTSQTIHYRIYCYNWIFTLILFDRIFYQFSHKLINKISVYTSISVCGIMAIYIFYFSSYTKADQQVMCRGALSVPNYLYKVDPFNGASDCLFIWDIPSKGLMSKYPACKKDDLDCLSWRSATFHLLKE